MHLYHAHGSLLKSEMQNSCFLITRMIFGAKGISSSIKVKNSLHQRSKTQVNERATYCKTMKTIFKACCAQQHLKTTAIEFIKQAGIPPVDSVEAVDRDHFLGHCYSMQVMDQSHWCMTQNPTFPAHPSPAAPCNAASIHLLFLPTKMDTLILCQYISRRA